MSTVRPLLPTLTLGLALAALAGCTTGGDEPQDDGLGTQDGVTYQDTDGDTIIDAHEGLIDNDGDESPNYDDTDSDGDQIPDSYEAGDEDPLTLPFDSDEDGTPDFLDTDSDNNGITDREEAGTSPTNPVDTDGDGTPDFADLDNDGDSLTDSVEIGDSPGDPRDSDFDGRPDYMDTDSDGDTIQDQYEAGVGAFDPEPRDTDEDGIPDYLDTDSDDDGIDDRDEAHLECADCPPRDLDGDGLGDFIDADADGDGLADDEELRGADGALNTGDETDPYDSDSDGDGYTDGAEQIGGSNPNNPNDWPEGIYVVVEERSTTEENFTFTLDLNVADIIFVLDTTCSMSGTLTSVASSFSYLVTEISATIPNVAFGVVQFRDYNDQGFGSGTDLPFYLEQQVTTDTGLVQAALSSLYASGGSDGPESSMEALYQTVTGVGYDQDCDDAYDMQDDVKPFIPSPYDAFGGTVSGVYDPTVPDTGEGGGVGFRPYSLPIIVWASDNYVRDPEAGYGTPPLCSEPAAFSTTRDAVLAAGAKVIAIDVTTANLFLPQALEMVYATDSLADLDGDGLAEEPLAFTGTSASVVASILEGIPNLASSGVFDVTLEVPNDEHGFVAAISPQEGFADVPVGSSVSFSLTFQGVIAATTEDQLYHLDLNVLGDGVTLLDQKQIIVVVPGSAN